MLKPWAISLAAAVGMLAAYLLFWPVPISPVRWTPPDAPERVGMYAPNDLLADITRLEVGRGPESVAIDGAGRVVCGLEDGRIVRASIGDGSVESIVELDGRPLGMAFDEMGDLIVCDLSGRLVAVSPNGSLREIVRAVDGEPLGLVNDLDLAADGTIYVSESSTETTDTLLDLLEHRAHGRLLAVSPDRGSVDVLLDGLYYANGVALSPDGSFVLVVETTAYRVRRLWLDGSQRGDDDVFIDNLPGFPDGISCDENGIFWLALVNPRNGFIDWALERPWIRRVAARLPLDWFADAAPRVGFVLGLDGDGNVGYALQDPTGERFAGISSVFRFGDDLYLGSLLEDAIGRVAVPAEAGSPDS